MDSKFIKKIASYLNRTGILTGKTIYYKLQNGNRAKAWCEEYGVKMEIINQKEGKVDGTYFPFSEYFEPTQCGPRDIKWTQHIDGNHWYFENVYKHVLPKDSDYQRLADAIETYIQLFE